MSLTDQITSVDAMKQADLGLSLSSKGMHKREFLEEINYVVLWAALVELITPYSPAGRLGSRPFALETILRVHFMPQWFGLGYPAMEGALFDDQLYRKFTQLDSWTSCLPDQSTILRFRHRLENHKLAAQILPVVNEVLQDKGLLLKAGTVVNATLINAPSSTKNAKGEREPNIPQTLKKQPWYCGIKAHIAVDANTGLVHTVTGTAANVNDAVEGNSRLHGQDPDALTDQMVSIKDCIRAKVKLAFRLIKRQFGYVKARYRGLKKNTAQITTLFALSNLLMVRHKLIAMQA